MFMFMSCKGGSVRTLFQKVVIFMKFKDYSKGNLSVNVIYIYIKEWYDIDNLFLFWYIHFILVFPGKGSGTSSWLVKFEKG